MASKRDYITEIVQKRSRLLKRVGRWELFSRRHSQVLSAFEYLRKSRSASLAARQELLRYVPIGTVACLEAYYRMVIRDLIDHGAPYAANARKLEDIKLDVATVLGLGDEKISIGEFVSHLVPLSSAEDINRHLSTLLDKDFLTELKNTYKAILEDKFSGDLDKEFVDIYNNLRTVFRLRHIFSHELAVKVKPTFAQMDSFNSDAVVFTATTEILVRELTSGNDSKASA